MTIFIYFLEYRGIMETNKNITNNEWKELCSWVEKNIFNYSENQKLQKAACLVLQGLKSGQAVANNKCEKHGEYPYKIILITFKMYKQQILNGILGKNFESERNKMSYVCAIVKDKLNDTYSRYLSAQKSEEKINNVNIDVMTYEGAEYKKQDNDKNNLNKFDDLW